MRSARKWGEIMGALEATIAIEGIKALTQLIFQLQRQGGLTDEQVDQAFEESRQEVGVRDPDELPNV